MLTVRRPPARDPRAPAQAVSPKANLRFDGAAGAGLPRPALPARGLPRPVRGGDGRAAREAGLPSHRRRLSPSPTSAPARASAPPPSPRRSTRARCPTSPRCASASRARPSDPAEDRDPAPVARRLRRPHGPGRDRGRPGMSATDPVDEARPRAAARRPAPARDQGHLAALRPSADKEGWPAARLLAALAEHEVASAAPGVASSATSSRPACRPGQDARQLRLRRRAVRRANSPPGLFADPPHSPRAQGHGARRRRRLARARRQPAAARPAWSGPHDAHLSMLLKVPGLLGGIVCSRASRGRLGWGERRNLRFGDGPRGTLACMAGGDRAVADQAEARSSC